MDETLRKELEPYTATYAERIDVLKQLKQAGISTYLSCEPIMPVKECNPVEIAKTLKDYVDLFDFGKYTRHQINHYVPYLYYKDYKNSQFYVDAFSSAIKYCTDNNINYCISSHSKPFFKQQKLSFRPYPLLKPIAPKEEKTALPILDKAQTSLMHFF